MSLSEMNCDYGSLETDESVVREFLDRYMPEASGTEIRGEVSVFQMMPNADYIIDFHPVYDNVLIASGFSGHAFKFVSVIGEILCQLLKSGKSSYDLSAFDIEREGIIIG